MKKLMILLAVLFAAETLAAGQDKEADKLEGVYFTEGVEVGEKSKIKIYRKGDNYEAKIFWVENRNNPDGTPRRDDKNPDPALRSRTVDEVVVMWNMKYDPKKQVWTGGKIYNPVAGKVYDVNMEFENPERLKVRGYIGKPMLGKSFYWNKLE